MQVKHLCVQNFRNLSQVDLRPHQRFNIICGDNGQGKTNLIESIYWLATLRPFRTTRIRELIKWDSDSADVAAVVDAHGLEHRLSAEIKNGQRDAFREGKKVRSSQYFGALSVVLFTPDDVGLIRGSPENRRRFMDRAIFNGRQSHLDDCVTYRRALDSRNRLLRERAPDAMLDVYEQTLAQVGAQIIRSRAALIDSIEPLFIANIRAILGEEVAVSIRYKCSVSELGEPIEHSLMTLWQEDRLKDRDRGFTQKGPHTEDLVISLFGHSARNYASQGQQRSMVLALKISEIQLLKERSKQIPVVLLDDVSSELDAHRNKSLFDFLNQFDGQVFITTTDPAYLRIEGDREVYRIQDGELFLKES